MKIPITIAIANQKGGTAKTTTAVNLAAALASSFKTLVVDVDGQANATRWLGADPAASAGVFGVITGETAMADIIAPSKVKGVDLAPGSQWLSMADTRLAAVPGREYLLREALATVASRYDVVVIDCPPALGVLSLNALTAATHLLVPCDTCTMAMDGLAALFDTMATVKARLNPSLELLGVVPSRYDGRTNASAAVLEALRTQLGAKVTNAIIRESVRMIEAPSNVQSIFDYAPTSSCADDFRALAKEVRRKTHLTA